MAEIKRITPEEVIAAYKATGLKPFKKDWFSDDLTCGCAIGAIAASRGIRNLPALRTDAGRILGYHGTYIVGFTCGFEGMKRGKFQQGLIELVVGWDDGETAAAAVFSTPSL
jgi:hypothetical protein